jgi:hypothetical protein
MLRLSLVGGGAQRLYAAALDIELHSQRINMRLRIVATALVVVLFSVGGSRPVSARDDRLKFQIRGALGRSEAKQKLDPEIRLYFGKAGHPTPQGDMGDYRADKKTRSIGRSDQDACEWAFLSALIDLQQRARTLGANAVIGIESFFKEQTSTSETEFECGAGSMMAAVNLRGKLVKLPGKK